MALFTNEEWIEKCKVKYGNRFSYEHTNYINSYHKVKITCKEHNKVFEVDPISFTRKSTSGHFCPICKPNGKLTDIEFQERCVKKYKDRYDFHLAVYKNIRESVKIICPKHGDFLKTPKSILYDNYENRSLCPECLKEEENRKHWNMVIYYTRNPEKGEGEGVFYKLKVTHTPTKIQFLKIGITSYTTYQRYKNKAYKDFKFELLEETFDTNLKVAILEENYKKLNHDNRFYLPKDIKFAGKTECYVLDELTQLKASQIKFIRDSLLVKQEGMCAICGKIPQLPTLDHHHCKKHHGDGLVRGVLCNQCNRFLGVLENNILRNCIEFSDVPFILRELADFLTKPKEPYIHPTEAPRKPKLKKASYKKLIKVVDGKQKVPEYKDKKNNFSKPLKKLFEKYGVIAEFYK